MSFLEFFSGKERKLKVSQILNNNVALVQKGGTEVIVVSKGIGFKKKRGQVIEEAEIEKMYILDSHDMLNHFSYLLLNSDPNDILLINRIITYGEKELDLKASDYLSLALLDHLDVLLKRAEEGQFIKSPLIWDTKRFYPVYFKVGKHALEIIEEEKGILLPEDEAVAIALHFINMGETKSVRKNRIREVNAISDIVSIIELQLKIKLDEKSVNYMRFFTHLQYFIQRVIESELHEGTMEPTMLYKQVSQMYPLEFDVVQKIKKYVKKQFETEISIDEETYLIIHIHRVTERMEKRNGI